jgi:hypothetical protein
MSRSRGEVHDNVPTSSSMPGADLVLSLLVGPDVAIKDTMRTEGWV